jgi:hypothetical protein
LDSEAAFGPTGTEYTPTLPQAKVMQANGGNILTTDVRSDTATGAAAGGTLDIEADNPPIGNQGLAMGL